MAKTCAEKLAEAKDALHALIMGESIVEVSGSGRSNKYTPADESKLRRYIMELEKECGNADKGHAGPVSFYG
jgi:hypothetical protein